MPFFFQWDDNFFTGLPGEAVEGISSHVRSLIGGPAKLIFECKTIFGIVFALCDNLLRLSSPGKLPQVCVNLYISASLERSCDLGVAPEFFYSSCLRIIIEKTRL